MMLSTVNEGHVGAVAALADVSNDGALSESESENRSDERK